MVKTARAIIKVPGKESIFSIKRMKQINGESLTYYAFPGGHVEENESFEDAVIREIKEEIGIEIKIEKEALHLYNKDLDRDEKFFICSYLSGIVGTGNGPEFTNIDFKKYGSFEVVEIKINKTAEYNILPTEVKENLQSYLQTL